MYGALFGLQFEVPEVGPYPFQNVVFIQFPPGWSGHLGGTSGTQFIEYQTSWQGSSIASGYILPGQTGKVLFNSSTPPPKTVPFGCRFYNNANAWGFLFKGTAHLVDH